MSRGGLWALAAVAAPLFFATVAVAQTRERPAPDLLERAANGDLAAPGGARRVSGDRTDAYRDLLVAGPARNVILLIGDGMGDSEITLARNYAEGAGGYFRGLDALPFSGHYTHYSLDRETGKPNYVTDSAASATAWATGVKTYNRALGVDIAGRPHSSLLQLARKAGLATGNVSTDALQGATPGAQVAHVSARACDAPAATAERCPEAALENGGLGSISEQLLDTRPDVSLGGGMEGFRERARAGKWKGMNLLDQARARGYRVVETADELVAVDRADADRPLLGLFAPQNMAVRWLGPRASYHGNLDQPAITCVDNPGRDAAAPTLAAMTQKAIALLRSNPKGFFLQVEGASIDKQNHAANPCGQIGETVDLDEAVQVALDFAKADGRTLVIVTADHAHASQIIGNSARAPGLTATLNTLEGGLMTVSYGTSEVKMGHTGTQLRIAAYGPRAANVLGLTDQTDLFFTIRDALGLADTADGGL
ncbi:alkaline phosphatase [Hephaestia caeni]|uniref:Alkaline phosphatase n=1 Tax=Hephaestia caeni TaxID=645617 RepID=A0A397PIG1_9SPHN|nr:alkaline phosphatase [Hephaestia caeni]RIA46947.1 alkaline phosphatase [Hephaestia caeni]